MDRIIEKKKTYLSKTVIIIATGLVLSALAYSSIRSSDLSAFSVDKGKISLATVHRGPFNVTVRGAGILVSKDISWTASAVDGRIDEVLVKPGAVVEKGDVLAVMANPLLERERDEMVWELEAVNADHQAQNAQLKSRILDQKSAMLRVKYEYERSKLRFDAVNELIEQGNHTVSMLEHKENQMAYLQFKQQLEIEEQRITNMQDTYVIQKNAWKARELQLQRSLASAKAQLDALTVKARISGVVQEVTIEAGQQITIGTNIAKLVRKDRLIAELSISELNIAEIAIGQKAIVDTRNSKLEGKVSRIAPSVANGDVIVDIEFTQELPADARPELSVNGIITVADMDEAVYVERPYMVQSNRQKYVYRLDENGVAKKTMVAFGIGAADNIVVLEGLMPGDKIVLSDTSSWEKNKEVRLN
ncbi:efflux RND transporter periplasmic adaptor subunit [Rheinheimera baltica]|uniref:efflux RND transporter periplasmic adaptor subunit n=1 Tax=Rheinheimera baltica TaxID=67576 RepID=UPI0004189BDE|nr:HlyD family efflux transporter periplasmic adaptor subunit [Rheinheimera baltica]